MFSVLKFFVLCPVCYKNKPSEKLQSFSIVCPVCGALAGREIPRWNMQTPADANLCFLSVPELQVRDPVMTDRKPMCGDVLHFFL